LPLPAFPNWQNISMPSAREHKEGEGLSLWTRYMNPAKLVEIHATVHNEIVKSKQKAVEQNAQGRDQAVAAIAQNPGFGLGV
jgi:hypothetical protein